MVMPHVVLVCRSACSSVVVVCVCVCLCLCLCVCNVCILLKCIALYFGVRCLLQPAKFALFNHVCTKTVQQYANI